MSTGHLALLIEDDEGAAKVLMGALRARGDEVLWAKTRSEARTLLAAHHFCYAFVDIEIPNEPGDIPNEATGLTCIKFDLRAPFRARTESDKHKFQILAVTGFSSEPSFVELVMQEGANAFVRKPLPSNLELARKVAEALRHSERLSHAECERIATEARTGSTAHPASLPPENGADGSVAMQAGPQLDGDGLRMTITGRQKGGRTVVVINGVECALPNAQFTLLLRLVACDLRERGTWQLRHDLGGKVDRGWELPSLLHRTIRKAIGVDDAIVAENDRLSSYRLHPSVKVEGIDAKALAHHSSDAVQKVAKEIARILGAMNGANSGAEKRSSE